MNEKIRLILFFSLIINVAVFAQPSSVKPATSVEAAPVATKDEYQKAYEERIKQTKIAGQYIPKDIFDAFKELNRLTDSVSRQKFMAATEYEVEHKLYFSLGRWICTNWSLYDGSRLGQYFREAGLSYPEDQAIAVLLTWHRFLHKKDIGFKDLRDKMVEKRKKAREEKLKKMEVIEEKIIKPAQKPKN